MSERYIYLPRRGTAEQAAQINEVLFRYELFLETDTKRLKVGDGVTCYNDLPYCDHIEIVMVEDGFQIKSI